MWSKAKIISEAYSAANRTGLRGAANKEAQEREDRIDRDLDAAEEAEARKAGR